MPPVADVRSKFAPAQAGAVRTIRSRMTRGAFFVPTTPHTPPPTLSAGRVGNVAYAFSVSLMILTSLLAPTELLNRQSKGNRSCLRACNAGAVGWRYRHTDKARLR